MATIIGIASAGVAGTVSIPGQIIVSLLNDGGGTPGSVIAILGVFTDAELAGGNLLEIVLSAPITLDPNTRYWIQVTGNSTTTYSWVQAANDSGTGATDEFWYDNADGTITSGANSAGPTFQMAVLTEPTMGVSGTGLVGAVSAIGGSIALPSGAAGVGLAGTVTTPGRIVISLLRDGGGVPGSLIAVLGVYEDVNFTLGSVLLDIDVSSLALDANTRYWVQVQGNAYTSLSWVEAANDSGTGVATELWYENINGAVTTGANSAGPAFQMQALIEPTTGVFGTAEVGSFGIEVNTTITGVAGDGKVGAFVVPGGSIAGVQGTGSPGTISVGRSETVSITGVQGTGAAGQIILGKKKRSGRGSAARFKPALFSRPDRRNETDAEAIARYRKIVDDLLAQPPLPPRQAEETGQPEPDDRGSPPDFSFLASLEQAEKPDVAPAVMSWHAQAVEEDRLLLGDASGVTEDLVRAEDDLLLSQLLDD